jgi:hypothetical protein
MLFGVDSPVPNAKEIHAIGSNKNEGEERERDYLSIIRSFQRLLAEKT